MRIEMNGTLQLQKSQIVLKCRRIVVSVDNDPLHILCYCPLLLKLSGNVVFSKDSHQIRQETESEVVTIEEQLAK